MKKNIIRKSYFFNKIYLRSTTRLVNLKKKPYAIKKRRIDAEKNNSLFILMRHNNTFITFTGDSYKLHNITAGTSGFRGPKRSSPYSRHVVARNMSYYMYKNKIKQSCDLYFNSMITRKFFFFFKGLVFKPFNVRYIIRNKMISHGFLRKKKKRRT